MCSFVKSEILVDGIVEDKLSYNFSHSNMDGTAAISHYMNLNGCTTSPRLSSYQKKISLWKTIRLIFQNLSLPLNE